MRFRFEQAVVLAAAALTVAWTGADAQQASGSFSRTLEVVEPLELDVETGSGMIDVRGGSSGRAVIVGRIEVRRSNGRSAEEAEEIVRRFEAEPPIELSSGRLRVGHFDDHDAWRNVSISYQIEVPARTAVRSRTGSGHQTVTGVEGYVTVAAGSGGVTLTEIGGAVEARTGSGSVQATGIAGPFRAETGSGSVTLMQTGSGDVHVSTGSGGSELRGIDGALHVRAGSGGIDVEGVPKGDWAIETGSGSVRVRLPEDSAFDIDVRTGSGRVYTDHPVTIRGSADRGALNGQVRSGGPLLRIRTGSGGIRIE